MRHLVALTFAFACSVFAGCVSNPPVASLPCGAGCTSSLYCEGALICHNGTCAPSGCGSCGAASCRYTDNGDGTCTFDMCDAP